jgi:hypothetical protein
MAGLQPVGNLPNGVTWSSSTYGEPKRKGNPYDPRTIIGEAEIELGDVDAYIAWRKSVGLKTLDPYTARSRMKTDKGYRKYLVAERKNQKEARKRQQKLEDEARKNARADAREAKKNAKSDARALQKRAIEIREQWDKFEGNPPDGYGESMKPEAAMREAYNRALGERKLMEEITGKTAMNTRSVSPSVAEAQSTGENGKPAGGKLNKAGNISKVPIGMMNGKQAYEVYAKGKNGWAKKGIDAGDGPSSFIPEDRMGTNKMRMDTFKSDYNKYKRDKKYTGDGIGSSAVENRMKKEWGDGWRDVYLDEQGGVKQKYWGDDGKPTDSPNAEKPTEIQAEEPQIWGAGDGIPEAAQPEPEISMENTWDEIPFAGMQPKTHPTADWNLPRIITTGSNTVPTMEPKPIVNREERMSRMKNTPNESISNWFSKRFNAMYPESSDEPQFVEPSMSPEDEEMLRQIEEEEMEDQRNKELILQMKEGMGMAPENYNMESGADYGFY